jgi:8-oxo-dGTP diphosphatase
VVLLIRHASAGDRYEWEGDDRLRPLDERGRRQANQLVELLEQYEITRLLSSPFLRCIQTVEPLAQARGFDIEIRDSFLRNASKSTAQPSSPLFMTGMRFSAAMGGLGEAICGESQKKAEVIVLDGTAVVTRVRGKGR